MNAIKDAVEKCLIYAKIDLTKKQQKDMELQLHFKSTALRDDLLSQDPTNLPNGMSTCHKLPASRNLNFFGRETEMKEIEIFLGINGEPVATGFLSVVLHGLGGMGKTQIALEFAYRNVNNFPVILWFNGETETSMQLSFGAAAVDWLCLQDAALNSDVDNRFALLKWLQETSKPWKCICVKKYRADRMITEVNWLLIYDNVEDSRILNEYLPVSPKKGSVIITSRKRSFNWNRGAIEIVEFAAFTGLDFITHLLKNRPLSDKDREAAIELSDKLYGHPLAINQMVALMDSKMWSFSKFLLKYETRRPSLLKEAKKEWSHGGYELLLGSLFSMSFGALSPTSRHMLGILSLISPDTITQDIFKLDESLKVPETLSYCQDEDE